MGVVFEKEKSKIKMVILTKAKQENKKTFYIKWKKYWIKL